MKTGLQLVRCILAYQQTRTLVESSTTGQARRVACDATGPTVTYTKCYLVRAKATYRCTPYH